MSKRVFAALNISSQARRLAADYVENLRAAFPQIRVGWERPEKLHLTLKFFGDVDEIQLENLKAAVSDAASQILDFRLQISGTGVFPPNGRARILWLGLKGENKNLKNLYQVLETKCELIGFPKESRVFNPHLTIARLREPNKSNALVDLHQSNEFTSPIFTVDSLVVFQSRLLANGSEYTPLSRAYLRKTEFPIDINSAQE